jgi:hypothetical protein
MWMGRMKTKTATHFLHQQRMALGAVTMAAAAATHAATPSRITDVTLYPDSATVVRTATVAAGAYHWAAVSEGGALFPEARVKRTQMMLDLRCPAASATQTCVPCHGSGCVSRRQ